MKNIDEEFVLVFLNGSGKPVYTTIDDRNNYYIYYDNWNNNIKKIKNDYECFNGEDDFVKRMLKMKVNV